MTSIKRLLIVIDLIFDMSNNKLMGNPSRQRIKMPLCHKEDTKVHSVNLQCRTHSHSSQNLLRGARGECHTPTQTHG